MGEIKNILWPNDLSKCSEGASTQVVSMAKKYNAVVHVLYVAQDLAHHEPWYGDFDRSHADRLVEWETKKARERQNELLTLPEKLLILYLTTISIWWLCAGREKAENSIWEGLLKRSLNIPRYRLSSLRAHKRNMWVPTWFLKLFPRMALIIIIGQNLI